MSKRLVSKLALVASLTLIYFAAGKLGLRLAFVNASATAVWPPTGIGLAAALVLGYGIWPVLLLGAFLVNVTTSGAVATSIAIAVGNTLESIVGAYLVNRFAHGRLVFERARALGVVVDEGQGGLGVVQLHTQRPLDVAFRRQNEGLQIFLGGHGASLPF